MESWLKADKHILTFSEPIWKVGVPRLRQFSPAAKRALQTAYLPDFLLFSFILPLRFHAWPLPSVPIFPLPAPRGAGEPFTMDMLGCMSTIWPSFCFFSTSSNSSCLLPSQPTSFFGVQTSLSFLQVQIWDPAVPLLKDSSCELLSGPVLPLLPVSPWATFSSPSPGAISSKKNFPLLTAGRTRFSVSYLPSPFLIPSGPFPTLLLECICIAVQQLHCVLSLCHMPVAEPGLLLHVLPHSWGLSWQLSKEAGSAAGCWLAAPNSSNTADSSPARDQSRSATTKRGDLETEASVSPPAHGMGLKCGHQYKCPGCTVASFGEIVSKRRERESFG